MTLTLCDKTERIARETVSVEYAPTVAPLPSGLSITDSVDRWQGNAPVAVLGGNAVRNFSEKEPDASRWWKGNGGLSVIA